MAEGFFTITRGKKLRNGFTTGSCAAGAAGAAVSSLLSGLDTKSVKVETPAGITLFLDVEDCVFENDCVRCSIVKDAGDDPDVTDGIKIWACAIRSEDASVIIRGGSGVGVVTRPGLSRKVGEPAINPVPMKMIYDTALMACAANGYAGGLIITVSAEKGEEIAGKTFNPRLGITGGISILGTSGIVEPMSEKALVDTVRLEIDSKQAEGREHLLLCIGNYGRDFVYERYGLDIETGVKCSNYIGEALDHAVYKDIKNILIVGHSGKLIKLAGGIMNTHSKIADCRCEIFAAHAAVAGMPGKAVKRIMEAATTDEIDEILEETLFKEKVWDSIMDKIMFHACHRLKGAARAEFIVFTNRSGELKTSPGAMEFMEKIKEESRSC